MRKFKWVAPDDHEIPTNKVTEILDNLAKDLEDQTQSLLKGVYHLDILTETDNELIFRYVFVLTAPYIGGLYHPIFKIETKPSTNQFPIKLAHRAYEGWLVYKSEINTIEEFETALTECIRSEKMRNFVDALYGNSYEERKRTKKLV